MSSTKRKSSKDRRFLVVALVVLLVALGYFMVWRPKAAQLADLRSERSSVEAALTATTAGGAGTTATTTAGGSAATTGSVSDAEVRLAAAVPATPALPDLLRNLESAAAASGVQSPSISTSAPAAGPTGSDVVTLTVSAQATTDAAYDYLGRLAGLDRLLIIDSVDIHEGSLTVAGRAFSTGL